MKKILHIVLSCFYVEGLSYQENILPKMHSYLGYETWVLTSTFSNSFLGDKRYIDVDDYVNDDNVHVIKLQRKNRTLFGKDVSFNSFYGVYKNLCKISPDIIFIHGLTSTANLEIAKYLKKRPNVLVFADQHGDFYNAPYKKIKQKLEINLIWRPKINKIINKVNVFFGTTPWRCEYLSKVYKIKKQKIRLLTMGVDTLLLNSISSKSDKSELRKKYNISMSDFVVCTGGKIDSKKNIHILIEAFKRINDENIKLLIFGNVSDDIKNYFFDLIKTDNRILYFGWANQIQIIEYFLLSDFGVFPGTHSVLWEQACGCSLPCAFNSWDGMKHVDVNGNCLFIDGNSISEIQTAINLVFKEKNVFKNMKENAIVAAKEFSYLEISKVAIGHKGE